MTIVLLASWIDSDVEWFLRTFFRAAPADSAPLEVSDREDAFAAVIWCTAHPAKVCIPPYAL
jgi:hypothetical protein